MNKEEVIKEYRREISSKGGRAVWAKMTPEERSARGRKMVAAREAKRRAGKL